MNMQIKIETSSAGVMSNSHWHLGLPYQAIVPVSKHPNGAILYQIAGSDKKPCGAEKAFRDAVNTHGGQCYYCKKALPKKEGVYQWTLDHIESIAIGGKDNLANYVIACQPCNIKKSHKPIDAFNPQATEKWLSDLRRQIDDRLKRLRAANSVNQPSSPPQPKQAAKADL
jgi:5-methylcytosine-specific restriction endonuclease McrA